MTILVGPNNVGKSMMINAFNVLRTFMFRGEAWQTESYNLGNFESAVHNHDVTRTIVIKTTVGKSAPLATVSTKVDVNGYKGLSYDPDPNQLNMTEVQALFRNCWYFRASRSEIPVSRVVGQPIQGTPWGQQLDPSGSNVVTFLLERYTDQDKGWPLAQEWLAKFDPDISIVKSPLRQNQASLVTTNKSNVDINLAYQGTGIQKAAVAVAATIFSPPESTLVIEEPEVHLHKNSQAKLADLFNLAVNKMGKQIIFSTHSWDLLLPYISDVCRDQRRRGAGAERIEPNSFKILEFKRQGDNVAIEEYPLKDKQFKDAQTHFGELLG